jgi:DNA-binding transcriptional ArsR family regulator
MEHMTATDFAIANKGEKVTITLADGNVFHGYAVSVNSKGFNFRTTQTGKVQSVSLNRVEALELTANEADDEMTDEDIYAELGDGMTTAELAAHLSEALSTEMTPKELRVHLRALGLGVGKGRKYALSATEYRMVRDLVKASA